MYKEEQIFPKNDTNVVYLPCDKNCSDFTSMNVFVLIGAAG